MNLLPYPRSLKVLPGKFTLPKQKLSTAIKIVQTNAAPNHPEGYVLMISKNGIEISFREHGGLRAATATLRQLLREYERRLPCLKIRDWPDFARRGVMLDISRGRVPRLETLIDLVERLADFKLNELQLYTEHTFAYRNFKSVWQSWGALTTTEIRTLDARCRELGIDLVPNQNSFGHLRYFLEHPKLKKLAEVSAPYESGSDAPSLANEHGDEGVAATSTFLRRPTTLAPNNPGTLPFLRELYDELLPNFSSDFFNVGCDETWDLGRGQSKKLCARLGKGRVYLDFLKQIQREVSRRGRTMMFWGDIILKYPKLIPALASFGGARLSPAAALTNSEPAAGEDTRGPNLIALNWGYEANHPFDKEAARFAKARIPFYVCPGTSTWQSLIGRHDNAFINLRDAANAGRKCGAIGYLITDWGDGGHPQPLAVSWLPYLFGASLSWCAKSFDARKLIPVLSRDIFHDPTQRIAKAALALGMAHRKLDLTVPNETPLGTVIAAPTSEQRELFCRNGLKWFAKIPAKKIRAALNEINKQISVLSGGQRTARPTLFAIELNLAARMAAQSCKFMLWQQAVATGRTSEARQMAVTNIPELRALEREFNTYWSTRNKGTTAKCSAFLKWRIGDYRRGYTRLVN